MTNRTDQLLTLQGADSTVDEIMEVYSKASGIYERALVAMGQKPIAVHSTVASTRLSEMFPKEAAATA